MEQELLKIVETSQYPPQAFVFVQQGLDYTVRRIHGPPPEERGVDPAACGSRHVSGAQLCQGLRDYALDRYGLLARAVLRRWHIHRCEDFGRIVFAMIEAGIMQKTEEDTLRDFEEVFDFDQAFDAEVELSGTD
jgi:uncharacterized repeat protein (TIGR04138 family)